MEPGSPAAWNARAGACALRAQAAPPRSLRDVARLWTGKPVNVRLRDPGSRWLRSVWLRVEWTQERGEGMVLQDKDGFWFATWLDQLPQSPMRGAFGDSDYTSQEPVRPVSTPCDDATACGPGGDAGALWWRRVR